MRWNDLRLQAARLAVFAYCDEVAVLGWQPQEPYFHLFRVEIGNVTVIRYALSGDQHVARWPSGKEFVRRATSPTSVGVEEPVVDLLRPATS